MEIVKAFRLNKSEDWITPQHLAQRWCRSSDHRPEIAALNCRFALALSLISVNVKNTSANTSGYSCSSTFGNFILHEQTSKPLQCFPTRTLFKPQVCILVCHSVSPNNEMFMKEPQYCKVCQPTNAQRYVDASLFAFVTTLRLIALCTKEPLDLFTD